MKCIQKMNVIARISCYLAQCHYAKIAQRIFNYNDTKHQSYSG